MGKISAVNQRIYADQHHISSLLNTIVSTIDREAIVVTGFGEAGPRRLVGDYDHSLSFSAFNDHVDDGLDEIIAGWQSAATVQICHQMGIALGSIAYEHRLQIPSQPRIARKGDAHVVNIEGAGSERIFRGVLLTADVDSFTANANGTGVNFGTSAATDTIAAVVRCSFKSGSSLVVTVQDSPDNASWANTGLAATINATGVTFLTNAEATDTWKRIAVTSYSGGGRFDLHVTFGILAT